MAKVKTVKKEQIENLINDLSGKKVRRESTDVLLFERSKVAIILKTLSDESEDGKLLGWRQQPRQEPLAEQADVRKLFSGLGFSTAVLLMHPDMPDDIAYITFADYERDISVKRTFRISQFKKSQIKSGGAYTPEKNDLEGQYCDFDFLKNLIMQKGNKNRTPTNTSKNAAEFNCYSIIFCGPPGTGKTRTSLILIDKILSNIEIENLDDLQLDKLPPNDKLLNNENFYRVQFHPSFSYEVF